MYLMKQYLIIPDLSERKYIIKGIKENDISDKFIHSIIKNQNERESFPEKRARVKLIFCTQNNNNNNRIFFSQ